MGITPRPKSIRAFQEIRLEHRFQYACDRSLEQAVFDRGNSQRPRPYLARSLGYLHSAHRWSPIGPSLQTFAQLLNASVELLFEFLRRLAIDTACAPTIHLLPGLSEKLRCEQMRQRGEAYLPIRPCFRCDLIQLCGHSSPTSECVGNVSLDQQLNLSRCFPLYAAFPTLRVLSAGPTSTVAFIFL